MKETLIHIVMLEGKKVSALSEFDTLKQNPFLQIRKVRHKDPFVQESSFALQRASNLIIPQLECLEET
jgi:hypothetical protein